MKVTCSICGEYCNSILSVKKIINSSIAWVCPDCVFNNDIVIIESELSEGIIPNSVNCVESEI